MAVATAETTAPATKKRPRFFTMQNWWGVLWVLPSLVAVTLFVYGFIGWTARVSVSAWKGLEADYTYVGLDNFQGLASDPRFDIDIQNTAIFTVVFVLGCLAIGLGLAILLDKGIRAEGFFRSLFLFPMAISFIVTGVVWRWLMNPAQGDRLSGLNLIFDKLGLDFLINQWHGTPRPARRARITARGRPSRRRLGTPGLPQSRDEADPTGDPQRHHHPRPHLPQSLRFDCCDGR
jgi:ABC-type sugar transport system permease subunit